ncbi:unnamed protein product [Chrysodeixis includens]|uniref:Uncharacterized protein n=1 Tax=Chrysodeixis includens TaxID=689277 RepID=A0A9N8KSA5_CHRIL|nr:unnamed protein product [Chrysodeixis includens]
MGLCAKRSTCAETQPIRNFLAPHIFAAAVAGQRTHIIPRPYRSVRISPHLTSLTPHCPTWATAAVTSSFVTESSRPVMRSSALFVGLETRTLSLGNTALSLAAS